MSNTPKQICFGQECPQQWQRSLFIYASSDCIFHVAQYLQQGRWGLENNTVVFLPGVPPDGRPDGNRNEITSEEVKWEQESVELSDKIIFWISAQDSVDDISRCLMNFGRWASSGKVIFGVEKSESLESKQREVGVSSRKALLEQILGLARTEGITENDSLAACFEMYKEKTTNVALRTGFERNVPLHVWNHVAFQDWYGNMTRVGNRLDGAQFKWAFCVGKNKAYTLYWVLHVNIWVTSEGRHKSNEIVLARSDIKCVFPYYIPEGGEFSELDCEVVLIKEFRSPCRTEDGFIHELPGGSAFKKQAPLVEALEELKEETGLVVDDESRMTNHGARQLAGTTSAHQAHLFSIKLNKEEIEYCRENAANKTSLGNASETEKTYLEVHKLGDLLKTNKIDWCVLGMIHFVLHEAVKKAKTEAKKPVKRSSITITAVVDEFKKRETITKTNLLEEALRIKMEGNLALVDDLKSLLGQPASELPAPPRKNEGNGWLEPSKDHIIVAVMSASGLPRMDENGLSDPFVKISFGIDEVQTNYVPVTLNPIWNQLFCFKLHPELINSQKEIHFDIYDFDTFKDPDFIGHTTLKVDDIDGSEKALPILRRTYDGSSVQGHITVIAARCKVSLQGACFQQGMSIDRAALVACLLGPELAGVVSSQAPSTFFWKCEVCTCDNVPTAERCEACSNPKENPNMYPSQHPSREGYDEDLSKNERAPRLPRVLSIPQVPTEAQHNDFLATKFTSAHFGQCLKDKKVLVIGMGGGCDVFMAYSMAQLLRPQCQAQDILYANCTGERPISGEFQPLLPGVLYGAPEHVRKVQRGERTYGTTLLEQSVPRILHEEPNGSSRYCSPLVLLFRDATGVDSKQKVLDLSAHNASRLSTALDKLGVDYVVGIDCGGDSLSGGKDFTFDPITGRDQQILNALRKYRVGHPNFDFLHVVLAPGCDGETSEQNMIMEVYRPAGFLPQCNGRQYRGAFSLKNLIKDCFEKTDVRNVEVNRTPFLMYRALKDNDEFCLPRLEGDKSGKELVIIERHRNRQAIPRSWLLHGLVFTYDPKMDNYEALSS